MPVYRPLFRCALSVFLCRNSYRTLGRAVGFWRANGTSWVLRGSRLGIALLSSWLLLLFIGEFLASLVELSVDVLTRIGVDARRSTESEAPPRPSQHALGAAFLARAARIVRLTAPFGLVQKFRLAFGTRLVLCWGTKPSHPWAEQGKRELRPAAVDPGALLGQGVARPRASNTPLDWVPHLQCCHDLLPEPERRRPMKRCFGIGVYVPALELVYGASAAETSATSNTSESSADPVVVTIRVEQLYVPVSALVILLGRYLYGRLQRHHRGASSFGRRETHPSSFCRVWKQRLEHALVKMLYGILSGIRAAQVATVLVSASSPDQGVFTLQRLECELDRNTPAVQFHGRYGLYAKPKRSGAEDHQESFARAFLRALRGTQSEQQYAGIGVFGCVHLCRSLEERNTRCHQNAAIIAWYETPGQLGCGAALLGSTHGVYRSRPPGRDADKESIDSPPHSSVAIATPPTSARRNADLQFEMAGIGLELSFELLVELAQRYTQQWLRRQARKTEQNRVGRSRSDSGAKLLQKLSHLAISLHLRNVKLDFIGKRDEVRLEASELELFLDQSKAGASAVGAFMVPEARPFAKSLHIRLDQAAVQLFHRLVTPSITTKDDGALNTTLTTVLRCGMIFGSLEEAVLERVELQVAQHPLLVIAQLAVVQTLRQVQVQRPRLDWCPDAQDGLEAIWHRWRTLLPQLDEHLQRKSQKRSELAPTRIPEDSISLWQLNVVGEASAWGRFPHGNNSGMVFDALQMPLQRQPWRIRVERLSWFVDDRCMGHAAQTSFCVHWGKEKRLIEAHTALLRFQMPYGFRFLQQYNLFLAHLRLYFRYRKTFGRHTGTCSARDAPGTATWSGTRKSIFPDVDIRADEAEFVLRDHELEHWFNERFLVMVDEAQERVLRERLAHSMLEANRPRQQEILADELEHQHATLYVRRMQQWQQQRLELERAAAQHQQVVAPWMPDAAFQQLFVARAMNVRFRLIRSRLSRAEENREAAAFAARMDATFGEGAVSSQANTETAWSSRSKQASETAPSDEPAKPEAGNGCTRIAGEAELVHRSAAASSSGAPTMSTHSTASAAVAPGAVQPPPSPPPPSTQREHLLDPNQWYTLGRRRLVIDIDGELVVHLRHFPFPVVQLEKGLRLRGTVALGELHVCEPFAAERDLQLSQSCWVRYRRAISPNRWYCDWDLMSGGRFRLNWSRALIATLKDMMDGFQGFAGAGKDPSPLLNWWNQLRLLIHGRWRLHCPEGFQIVLLSSAPYNPEYDERIECCLTGPRTGLCIDRRLGTVELEADAWKLLFHVATSSNQGAPLHAPSRLCGAEPIHLLFRVDAEPALGVPVSAYPHPLGYPRGVQGPGERLPPAVPSTLVPLTAAYQGSCARLAARENVTLGTLLASDASSDAAGARCFTDSKQLIMEPDAETVTPSHTRESAGVHADSTLADTDTKTSEHASSTASIRREPYAVWYTPLADYPQHDTYRSFRARALHLSLQCKLSWSSSVASGEHDAQGAQLTTYALASMLFRVLELAGVNRLLGQSPYAFRPVSRKVGLIRSGKRRYGVRFGELVSSFSLSASVPKPWALRCYDALRPTEHFTVRAGPVMATLCWCRPTGSAFESIRGRAFEQNIRVSADWLRIDLNRGLLLLQTGRIHYERALEVEKMQGLLLPSTLDTLRIWPDSFAAVFATAKKVSQRTLLAGSDALHALFPGSNLGKGAAGAAATAPATRVAKPERTLVGSLRDQHAAEAAQSVAGTASGAVNTSAGTSGSGLWNSALSAPKSTQSQQHELGNRARRLANALGMSLSMQRKPETDVLDLRDLLLQEHLEQVKRQQQQQQQQEQRQRTRSGSAADAAARFMSTRGTPARERASDASLQPRSTALATLDAYTSGAASTTAASSRQRRAQSLEAPPLWHQRGTWTKPGHQGALPQSLTSERLSATRRRPDEASRAWEQSRTSERRSETTLHAGETTQVPEPLPQTTEAGAHEANLTSPNWIASSSERPPVAGQQPLHPRVPETADIGLPDSSSGRSRYTQRRQLLSQRVRFQLTLIEPAVWIRSEQGRDAVRLSANQGILDVVEGVCHRGAQDLGTEIDYRVCLRGVNITVEGQELSHPAESAPIFLYYIHPVPAEDLRARHVEVVVPALHLAATAPEFHTLFRIVREVLLSKGSQALRVSRILKPLRQRAVVFEDADFVIERALTLRALLQDVDLLLLHGGEESLASLWTQLDSSSGSTMPPEGRRGKISTEVGSTGASTGERLLWTASGGLRITGRASAGATADAALRESEEGAASRPTALSGATSAGTAAPQPVSKLPTSEQAFAFRWWLAAQARAWQVLLVDALRGRIHYDDRSTALADELEDLDIILEVARVRWSLLLSRRRAFLEVSIRRIYGLQRRYMSGRELNDYGITDLVVQNRSRDLDLGCVIRGDSFRYVSVSEGVIGGIMRYSRLTLDMAKTLHIRLYGVLVDRLNEYFFGVATSTNATAAASAAKATVPAASTVAAPVQPLSETSSLPGMSPAVADGRRSSVSSILAGQPETRSAHEPLHEAREGSLNAGTRRSPSRSADNETLAPTSGGGGGGGGDGAHAHATAGTAGALASVGTALGHDAATSASPPQASFGAPPVDAALTGTPGYPADPSSTLFLLPLEEGAQRYASASESRSSARPGRGITATGATNTSITPVQIDYAYLSSLEIIGSYHSGTGKEHSFLDFDDLCVLVPSLMYQAVTGSWQGFIEMVRRDFASAFVRDAIGQLSKRKFLGFLRRPFRSISTIDDGRSAGEPGSQVAVLASPAATEAAIRRRRQRGRTPIVQAVEQASAAAAVRSTAREHLSELVLFGSLRLVRRALMRDPPARSAAMNPEQASEPLGHEDAEDNNEDDGDEEEDDDDEDDDELLALPA